MNQKTTKLLIKLLNIATPILLISNSCLPAKADYEVMSSIIYGDINKSMNERNIENNDSSDNDSDSTATVVKKKKQQTNNWSASKTTFNPDPEITRELKNSWINHMDTPLGKKYISFMLTPENVKNVYGSFHQEERINFNDIADVFTLASLRAFMTIENRKSVSTEQVRGVRTRFRNIFANHSLDRNAMQRTTQGVLYWTMLRDLGITISEKNNDNSSIARHKAEAGSMMTTMGLNPQKYTLGDRGFVEK